MLKTSFDVSSLLYFIKFICISGIVQNLIVAMIKIMKVPSVELLRSPLSLIIFLSYPQT